MDIDNVQHPCPPLQTTQVLLALAGAHRVVGLGLTSKHARTGAALVEGEQALGAVVVGAGRAAAPGTLLGGVCTCRTAAPWTRVQTLVKSQLAGLLWQTNTLPFTN